ncbi:Panacea domain-containing protein [Neobacillus sp. KR4-4]|uniref:Panacea domain-containing protein n=1 Tax=Neobacillus sp. KR4-4 TaxID=3344872 RepID=UPI0035C967BD
MANVLNVAKYFISKSVPGTPLAITHLKLQKLVYYAQGWNLAINRKPLFQEEIRAWDHGPVVPELYYEYRSFGYFTIQNDKFNNKQNGKNIFSKAELKVLDQVWEEYGKFDGKFLEELTHQEDPWLYTNRNGKIEQNSMQKYFQKLL